MRLNRKALKWISLIALFLVVAVAVLVSAEWAEGKRSAGEEYAVYSAYLRDGLLNEAHDWGANGPVLVVIRDTTSVGENLRIKPLYVFDSRANFDQLDRSTRLSYLVRNLFPTQIQAQFRLPRFATVAIASRSDYFSPAFQKDFPHNQGLIALSGVGFNRTRTQAVFYIDHFCGLCGGGRYVLMAKIDGIWHVQNEHSTWVS